MLEGIVGVKRILLILSLLIYGCTKQAPEKLPIPSGDGQQVPIDFGGGIINTKAPIISTSGIPTAQILAIQVLRQDVAKNSSPNWSTVSSVSATATFFPYASVPASNIYNFVVNPKQYYNLHKNNYSHFTAYYPGVNENAVATTLASGVATFTITGQEDIISAPSVNAGGSQNQSLPVSFVFSHKLSQVQIYVKAANAGAITSWGNVTAVKATSATRLNLTVSTQTLSQHATPVVSDLSTGKAPQALTTDFVSFGTILVYPGALTIKVTTANFPEQTVTISPSITTAAGSSHRIDLTFTATAINFNATLTGWVTGTPGAGTVQ